MSETISMQDQIDYLEAYAKMIQSQHDMIQVQIKFLKAGKNMQDNFSSFQGMFGNMYPYFNNKGTR